MSAQIIGFTPDIVGDGFTVDPDEVLQGCLGKLKSVVVIGIDEDGDLWGSASDGRPETIALLERAKARLLASYDD